MCFKKNNAKKNGFFEKTYKGLFDSKMESFEDFDNMLGVDFEGAIAEVESLEDYADNVFLFVDQWTEYLRDESLIHYGWLDIDMDCFWEAQYNALSNYIIVLSFFSLLFFFKFYFISFFYLAFAITWNCYDEELEHNADSPNQVIKEMKKHIKHKKSIRKHIRIYKAYLKNLDYAKRFDIRWRVFVGFFASENDSFMIDDLFLIQIQFELGRWLKEDDRYLKFAEYWEEITRGFYDLYIIELIKIAYKLEKIKNPHSEHLKYAASYLLCYIELLPIILKPFTVGAKSVMLEKSISDYELFFFNLYVKNWYYLNNLSPKKFKKHNYIL